MCARSLCFFPVCVSWWFPCGAMHCSIYRMSFFLKIPSSFQKCHQICGVYVHENATSNIMPVGLTMYTWAICKQTAHKQYSALFTLSAFTHTPTEMHFEISKKQTQHTWDTHTLTHSLPTYYAFDIRDEYIVIYTTWLFELLTVTIFCLILFFFGVFDLRCVVCKYS